MDIDKIFTYHNPSNIDPKRFEEIRNAAKNLGHQIMIHGGNKEEKNRAIIKLREAVFFAIASIAIPEDAFDEQN